MADSSKYVHSHQFEPLRVPSGWGAEEKRLIAQLTEVLEDIYRRWGRLRFEDMNRTFRQRIEDDEGNILEVQQTAEALSIQVTGIDGQITLWKVAVDGVTAAVNHNRLHFDETGLKIINAQGEAVFVQDIASGDLEIIGTIVALAGRIGGFTLENGVLHNGSTIRLDPFNGVIQLGNMTLTDEPGVGPNMNLTGGLRIMINGIAHINVIEGRVEMMFPTFAQYGLYVDPNRTTPLAANAYIDPATGEILRSTAGGGGPDPGGALSATLGLSTAQVLVGTAVTLTASAFGGTAPYGYEYAVSENGGAYQAITGSGAMATFAPQRAGTYRFQLLVRDGAGAQYIAYSGYLTANSTGSGLTVSVAADRASISSPQNVTWTVSVQGGSGSYTYALRLFKNSQFLQEAASSTLTRYLSEAGQYFAEVEVWDAVTGAHESVNGGSVLYGGYVQMAVVTGDGVRIRSAANLGASVIGYANEGDVAQILGGPTNGFYQVYCNSVQGWMSSDYLILT